MKKRPGTLLTIGSFDGVHLGHAALIERTVWEAKKRNLKSLALTFSLPPRMVLDPQNPVSILSTPEEKEILIKSHGIDEVLFLDFDKKFCNLKPFYFFKKILLDQLRAKGIVVGMDFRFGLDRSAGAVELVRWGQEFEIPIWVIPQVKIKNHVVSSTHIRSLFQKQQSNEATNYLGHPYLVCGQVVKGLGLGKKLGFATANLKIKEGKPLPGGVYIVKGYLAKKNRRGGIKLDKKEFYGVCNIGFRPTVMKKSKLTMEVHILRGPIPKKSQFMLVELVHRLRDEKKFRHQAALQKAIANDVAKALQFFKLKKAAKST